ncbi:MAG: hypothetical protein SGPRY_014056 [Prymnesium sp.]
MRFLALLSAALSFYSDCEHGSQHCTVPRAWRAHSSLTSPYSLSSLAFCIAGLYICLILHAFPSRALYPSQIVEGALWIWSGCISFVCDAVDLGVRSWSHPVDRLSASLFIAYNVLVYCTHVLAGTMPIAATIEFPVALAAGLYCFNRSSDAVHRRDMEGYFFWHSMWHLVLPLSGVLHFSLIVFSTITSVSGNFRVQVAGRTFEAEVQDVVGLARLRRLLPDDAIVHDRPRPRACCAARRVDQTSILLRSGRRRPRPSGSDHRSVWEARAESPAASAE